MQSYIRSTKTFTKTFRILPPTLASLAEKWKSGDKVYIVFKVSAEYFK